MQSNRLSNRDIKIELAGGTRNKPRYENLRFMLMKFKMNRTVQPMHASIGLNSSTSKKASFRESIYVDRKRSSKTTKLANLKQEMGLTSS